MNIPSRRSLVPLLLLWAQAVYPASGLPTREEVQQTLNELSTITGFLASYYWSASLSIGASAGIFGLIGAMIAMGMRDRSAYGLAVRGL